MAEFQNLIEAGIAGLSIILIGMIKIPTLDFNFWVWLGRIIGKTMNKEVLDRVDKLSTDLENFKNEEELERARRARQRILRFNDEILFDQRHSKEHFDEILEDIDVYEKYCHEHENYENNRAELAIATIQEVYKQCVKTHDFLVQEKIKKKIG